LIILDTSALVDSLTGSRRSAGELRRLVDQGNRIGVPTLVLYEWWRGPRRHQELIDQETLFPAEKAFPFGAEEALIASQLYAEVPHARGRELDLAIAAHAIVRDAQLWTLNPRDFSDVPSLRLVTPPGG